MKEYIFLILGGNPKTTEEINQNISQYQEYMKYLSDGNHFVNGAPLIGEKMFHVNQGVDGQNSSISNLSKSTGYMVIKAENVEQAKSVALKNPVISKSGSVVVIPIKK